MVIGRGAFGKVYLAQLKNCKELYAVKSIKKHTLIEYGLVDKTEIEKDIMINVDFPFIVNMEYSF